ncbi:hypothetical protein AB0F17_58515 [Nonomuraea sp. NPDC026600]|uniref:hypothetical protein n=1 Tax=Nonomuraea sp. NPDC026600 TaxID=3155363 RepID=UPI0033F5F5D3
MDWILNPAPALDRLVVLRRAIGDDEARLVLYDLPTGRKGDHGILLKRRNNNAAAYMNDTPASTSTPGICSPTTSMASR